jgi:ribonucleoside-diphosphate reductase alpha chain
MANNSAVWTDEMEQDQILTQMYEMIKGQRGEPGIFSRHNANELLEPIRKKFGYQAFGTNPCGEISLRPYEFCNLSIAIAREDDTEETLKEKVEVATIIGTIQSIATNFTGLRDIWRKNCEEERLLGVDINGWVDCLLLRPANPNVNQILEDLKKHAIEVNKKYAAILGINQSASVTCVKPSGNSGILFNCSSGLHSRWAPYYIRNMRIQAQSPLKKVLEEAGVPMDPENGQTVETANTWVIHFPIKSPEGSPTRKDMSAIQQCEYWLTAKKHWTTHNPSVTVTYSSDEVIDLINWVNEHKQFIGGMSFLPADDAQYSQMPNEEISKEQYEALIVKFPKIDFSNLVAHESSDMTNASTELACVSGACSIEEYQALQAAQQMNLT